MSPEEFRASVAEDAPRTALSAPLTALWWDAKGDWARAHALVDELETVEGMCPRLPAPQRGLRFER
jgi:hypothetical protein